MEITKSRITRLFNEMNAENCSQVKDELAELEQFINLGIQLIKEDSSLD